MLTLKNQNTGSQPQTKEPLNADSVGDQNQDFKQEIRRNKKLRFRKSDKRRRAELTAPSCP
jgi:hypothetical protein